MDRLGFAFIDAYNSVNTFIVHDDESPRQASGSIRRVLEDARSNASEAPRAGLRQVLAHTILYSVF